VRSAHKRHTLVAPVSVWSWGAERAQTSHTRGTGECVELGCGARFKFTRWDCVAGSHGTAAVWLGAGWPYPMRCFQYQMAIWLPFSSSGGLGWLSAVPVATRCAVQATAAASRMSSGGA
jgi:hypothetical protein